MKDRRTFDLGPRTKVFEPNLSIQNPEKAQSKIAKGTLAEIFDTFNSNQNGKESSSP
jgi:hypothetical protein